MLASPSPYEHSGFDMFENNNNDIRSETPGDTSLFNNELQQQQIFAQAAQQRFDDNRARDENIASFRSKRRSRRSRFRVSPPHRDRSRSRSGVRRRSPSREPPSQSVPSSHARNDVSPIKSEQMRHHARMLAQAAANNHKLDLFHEEELVPEDEVSMGLHSTRVNLGNSSSHNVGIKDDDFSVGVTSTRAHPGAAYNMGSLQVGKKKKKKKKQVVIAEEAEIRPNQHSFEGFNPTFPGDDGAREHQKSQLPPHTPLNFEDKPSFSNESGQTSSRSISGAAERRRRRRTDRNLNLSHIQGDNDSDIAATMSIESTRSSKSGSSSKRSEGSKGSSRNSLSSSKQSKQKKKYKYNIVEASSYDDNAPNRPKNNNYQGQLHLFHQPAQQSPVNDNHNCNHRTPTSTNRFSEITSSVSAKSSPDFHFDAFGLDNAQIDNEVSQWMHEIHHNEPEIHQLGLEASANIAYIFDGDVGSSNVNENIINIEQQHSTQQHKEHGDQNITNIFHNNHHIHSSQTWEQEQEHQNQQHLKHAQEHNEVINESWGFQNSNEEPKTDPYFPQMQQNDECDTSYHSQSVHHLEMVDYDEYNPPTHYDMNHISIPAIDGDMYQDDTNIDVPAATGTTEGGNLGFQHYDVSSSASRIKSFDGMTSSTRELDTGQYELNHNNQFNEVLGRQTPLPFDEPVIYEDALDARPQVKPFESSPVSNIYNNDDIYAHSNSLDAGPSVKTNPYEKSFSIGNTAKSKARLAARLEKHRRQRDEENAWSKQDNQEEEQQTMQRHQSDQIINQQHLYGHESVENGRERHQYEQDRYEEHYDEIDGHEQQNYTQEPSERYYYGQKTHEKVQHWEEANEQQDEEEILGHQRYGQVLPEQSMFKEEVFVQERIEQHQYEEGRNENQWHKQGVYASEEQFSQQMLVGEEDLFHREQIDSYNEYQNTYQYEYNQPDQQSYNQREDSQEKKSQSQLAREKIKERIKKSNEKLRNEQHDEPHEANMAIPESDYQYQLESNVNSRLNNSKSQAIDITLVSQVTPSTDQEYLEQEDFDKKYYNQEDEVNREYEAHSIPEYENYRGNTVSPDLCSDTAVKHGTNHSSMVLESQKLMPSSASDFDAGFDGNDNFSRVRQRSRNATPLRNNISNSLEYDKEETDLNSHHRSFGTPPATNLTPPPLEQNFLAHVKLKKTGVKESSLTRSHINQREKISENLSITDYGTDPPHLDSAHFVGTEEIHPENHTECNYHYEYEQEYEATYEHHSNHNVEQEYGPQQDHQYRHDANINDCQEESDAPSFRQQESKPYSYLSHAPPPRMKDKQPNSKIYNSISSYNSGSYLRHVQQNNPNTSSPEDETNSETERDIAMMIRRRIAKNKELSAQKAASMVDGEDNIIADNISDFRNKLKKVRITKPPPAPPLSPHHSQAPMEDDQSDLSSMQPSLRSRPQSHNSHRSVHDEPELVNEQSSQMTRSSRNSYMSEQDGPEHLHDQGSCNSRYSRNSHYVDQIEPVRAIEQASCKSVYSRNSRTSITHQPEYALEQSSHKSGFSHNSHALMQDEPEFTEDQSSCRTKNSNKLQNYEEHEEFGEIPGSRLVNPPEVTQTKDDEVDDNKQTCGVQVDETSQDGNIEEKKKENDFEKSLGALFATRSASVAAPAAQQVPLASSSESKMKESSHDSPKGSVKSFKTLTKMKEAVAETNTDTVKENPALINGRPALKHDPKYEKYFKMLKVGLPMQVVQHSMIRDGVDASVMDGDHSKPAGWVDGVPLKDDPKYSKYFKMLKVGLPLEVVKHAMERDGVESNVMDGDHNAPAHDAGNTKVPPKKLVHEPKDTHRRTRLHWDTLHKVRRNSVWALVNDDPEVEKIDIDENEFAKLFQAELTSTANKKNIRKDLESNRNVVKVIDPKRANNGGITLARIKGSYDEIARAIDQMDDTNMDHKNKLNGILEYLPTKAEKKALIEYKESYVDTPGGGFDGLCECEKFMFSMINVHHAKRKVRALMFKLQFTNCIDEVLNDANLIAQACEQLSKSVRFRKLLGIVLNIGNRLNTAGSSEKGKAGAFSLSSLLKLNQAKAFDKKTTFLHYVILVVKRNNEHLLGFKDDLPAVLKAEKIYWDQCVLDLEEAENQLENVRRISLHLARQSRPEWRRSEDENAGHNNDDSLSDASLSLEEEVASLRSTQMGAFTLDAIKKVSALRDKVEKTKKIYSKLLEYFGEDEQGGRQPHELFAIIVTFCKNFDTSLKEVDADEKKRLRAEQKRIQLENGKASGSSFLKRKKDLSKTTNNQRPPGYQSVKVSSMQPNMGDVLKDIKKLGMSLQSKIVGQISTPKEGPSIAAPKKTYASIQAEESKQHKISPHVLYEKEPPHRPLNDNLQYPRVETRTGSLDLHELTTQAKMRPSSQMTNRKEQIRPQTISPGQSKAETVTTSRNRSTLQSQPNIQSNARPSSRNETQSPQNEKMTTQPQNPANNIRSIERPLNRLKSPFRNETQSPVLQNEIMPTQPKNPANNHRSNARSSNRGRSPFRNKTRSPALQNEKMPTQPRNPASNIRSNARSSTRGMSPFRNDTQSPALQNDAMPTQRNEPENSAQAAIANTDDSQRLSRKQSGSPARNTRPRKPSVAPYDESKYGIRDGINGPSSVRKPSSSSSSANAKRNERLRRHRHALQRNFRNSSPAVGSSVPEQNVNAPALTRRPPSRGARSDVTETPSQNSSKSNSTIRPLSRRQQMIRSRQRTNTFRQSTNQGSKQLDFELDID